jgi:translation initiation factor IF-1
VSIDFFGSHTRYQVELADGNILKVSLHNRKKVQHKISTGDQVGLLFAVSDVFQINEN